MINFNHIRPVATVIFINFIDFYALSTARPIDVTYPLHAARAIHGSVGTGKIRDLFGKTPPPYHSCQVT